MWKVLLKKSSKLSSKIRDRGDISDNALDYFLVDNPKLVRFYLLPKINKRPHYVPGRPVI